MHYSTDFNKGWSVGGKVLMDEARVTKVTNPYDEAGSNYRFGVQLRGSVRGKGRNHRRCAPGEG